jgi:hypothetical protein
MARRIQPDEKAVVGDVKPSKDAPLEVQRETKESPARDPLLAFTAAERNALVNYLRALQTKPSPRFKLKSDKLTVELDHSSEPIVHPILASAFGSTDMAFVGAIVGQLTQAASDGCDEVDIEMLNFALAVINRIGPKNELQTMLAAQMAAVHMATMKYARGLTIGGTIGEQDVAQGILSKLARTFVTQMEAMHRYQFGGENVLVQQVCVAEGGQAIVSNLTQELGEKTPEEEAGGSAPVASADTNVVRMSASGEAEQVSKRGFRRRLAK